MKNHLAARHELITNVATLAREMLNDVECTDWKWKSYRDRLKYLIEDNPELEEKNATLNKKLKAFCEIIKVFLALLCICGAVILWLSVLFGMFGLLVREVTMRQLVVRIIGACAFTSPFIYAAFEGERK